MMAHPTRPLAESASIGIDYIHIFQVVPEEIISRA